MLVIVKSGVFSAVKYHPAQAVFCAQAQPMLCDTSLPWVRPLSKPFQTDSCPQVSAGTRDGQQDQEKGAFNEPLKSGTVGSVTEGHFFTQAVKNLMFSRF